MKVPSDALWGASTQRARENFPVSGRNVPVEVVHAFGLLKAACAHANMELGKLPTTKGSAIVKAAMEVAKGEHDDQFVVDVFQTGSGTSTNMNANEVIANRLLADRGQADRQQGAGPPERPREHGADRPTTPSRRRCTSPRRWRSRTQLRPRAGAPARGSRGQGEGVGQDRQDRPHAPDGRHADPRGPGLRRLRRPGEGRGRALRRRHEGALGTGHRRHRGRHRHQHASEVRRGWSRRSSQQAHRREVPRGAQPSRGPGGQGCVRAGQRRAEDHRGLA